MKRISKSTVGLLSAVLGGVIALAVMQMTPLGAQTNSHPRPKIVVQDAPINRDSKGTASYANVIRKVAPSVVTIYSTRQVTMRMPRGTMEDPFFRRFFGDQFGEEEQQGRRFRHTEQGLGSGVIFSADGYILTANHVVENASELKVDLPNGQKDVLAKVVGTDPLTDIAVLKVDGTSLPSVTIADSDKLEVGDVVLAIGNPFGVGQTVTMGIVSGLGRTSLGIIPQGYENFIQTDASINMGNSGGALVDAEGRLVGINTAIFSMTGGNAGIGFAVPVNLARFAMDKILSEGKVRRGKLGVFLQNVTPELAKEFKLSRGEGAMVSDVEPGSPGEKAGFQAGDVITEFNGKKVADSARLRLMVSQTPPGTKANFKVLRDGKERTMSATLTELKQDRASMRGSGGRFRQNEPEPTEEDDALNGVEVTDLDTAARREFTIPERVEGALITRVESDSESYKAGLRSGDVIVEIAGQPVRNAEDAIDASKKVTADMVRLRVWRDGGARFVIVRNSRKK
jgi:serine protease Do